MKDVLKHCEIWHKKYATAIMKILGEVFDDMKEYYEDNEMFEDEENSTIVSYEPVWDDIRNDSSLYSIADQSMELSDDENSQDTLEMSISFQGNNSSLFEMLAPKYLSPWSYVNNRNMYVLLYVFRVLAIYVKESVSK